MGWTSVSGWELRIALGLDLAGGRMAKCTQNVGIMGKYRTRYGARLWKTEENLNQASKPSTPAPSVARPR